MGNGKLKRKVNAKAFLWMSRAKTAKQPAHGAWVHPDDRAEFERDGYKVGDKPKPVANK